MLTRKKKDTAPTQADLAEIQDKIDSLEARDRELEQMLAGIDHRYTLSDEARAAETERDLNRDALIHLRDLAADISSKLQAAHEKRGQELAATFRNGFTEIEKQLQAARDAAASIQAKRDQYESEMLDSLAPWPELATALQRQFCPLQDEITALVGAALAYRKSIASVEDPFALPSNRLLAPIWYALQIGLDDTINGRYSKVTTDELEEWLSRYQRREL